MAFARPGRSVIRYLKLLAPSPVNVPYFWKLTGNSAPSSKIGKAGLEAPNPKSKIPNKNINEKNNLAFLASTRLSYDQLRHGNLGKRIFRNDRALRAADHVLRRQLGHHLNVITN